jgi:hypothetical protein
MIIPWTPESVREHLPDVTVKMNGKVYPAMVRGHSMRFAGVTIILSEHPWTLLPQFEVAWSTVAHCLNADQPILYS